MTDDKIPVFISYHRTDYNIAEQLRKSLEALSERFEIFLDKTSLQAGDDYRDIIDQELARAQWLLIVCTGFPRTDVDMSWSFFEAGQFSATLPKELKPHAHKRMVCLFDKEAPSVLTLLQGVRVTNRSRNGALIDIDGPDATINSQIDDTYIFNLFSDMLKNKPLDAIRDCKAENVVRDIREQSAKIIRSFEGANTPPIDEEALHPRLSYQIGVGVGLTETTIVKGYNKSLRTLFSLGAEECTWGEILECCTSPDHPRPMWLHDVEMAAQIISHERIPKVKATKCELNGQIYRVFTSRYEVFKNKNRTIYIAFLPANARNFDLKKNSGVLLSSLILSVRFREQIIPFAESFEKCNHDSEAHKLLLDFSRQLQAVELEALQFGIYTNNEQPDESAVSGAIRNSERRELIETGLAKWNGDRKTITSIFSGRDEHLENAIDAAKQLSIIINEIIPINSNFIKALCEELYRQSDDSDF